MRWQLGRGGWPILGGRLVVPEGQIIDTASWSYNGATLPMISVAGDILPANALPLDSGALTQILTLFPYYQVSLPPGSALTVPVPLPSTGSVGQIPALPPSR
jgi:hypothetical protein